jgi:anaerobic selenocysteine-containing dehydrogenase
MHEIIKLGLVDREFIAQRTTNYAELAKMVKDYPPERAAQICGVDAIRDTRGRAALGRGEQRRRVLGMGISQHTTGTDNARCLIALCSITGQVGQPGAGLHPLRGQNNVQGASDSGPDPDVLSRLPGCRSLRHRASASRAVWHATWTRNGPDGDRDHALACSTAGCAGCT